MRARIQASTDTLILLHSLQKATLIAVRTFCDNSEAYLCLPKMKANTLPALKTGVANKTCDM